MPEQQARVEQFSTRRATRWPRDDWVNDGCATSISRTIVVEPEVVVTNVAFYEVGNVLEPHLEVSDHVLEGAPALVLRRTLLNKRARHLFQLSFASRSPG